MSNGFPFGPDVEPAAASFDPEGPGPGSFGDAPAPVEPAPAEAAPAEQTAAEPDPGRHAAVAGDLATLAAIERDLQDVDAALHRLDAGTYGVCTSCGGVIGTDMLAAAPLTSRCVRCSPASSDVQGN